MYQNKSKNLIENYSTYHIPQGSACWPTINLSHLEPSSLERRCTDPENYNMSKLRSSINLDNKLN